MQSSSLFYNPEAMRLLFEHGFTEQTQTKTKPLKHGGKGVNRGEPKLDRSLNPLNPPLPPFLCVSKVLVFCYLARSLHFRGGCFHEAARFPSSARFLLCLGTAESDRASCRLLLPRRLARGRPERTRNRNHANTSFRRTSWQKPRHCTICAASCGSSIPRIR